MKLCQKFSLYFAIILILISVPSKAQKDLKYRDFNPQWEINFNGGLTQFYGDLWNGKILPSQNKINTWRYGKGLIIGRQISPIFGIRAQAFFGEIVGEKQELGANFISDIYEFNLHSTINLSNLFTNSNVNKTFNFYAVLGYGLVNYKSSKYLYDTDIILEQNGMGEGKGVDGMVLNNAIIGGFGLNVKLGNHWGINLESANRLLLSDKMDIFDDNEKMDMFNYTSIGLQYRFGKSRKKQFKAKDEPIIQEIIAEKPKEKEPVSEAVEAPKTDVTVEKEKQVKTDLQELKIEKKEIQTVKKVKEEAQPKINAEVKTKTKTKTTTLQGIEYRVQIHACSKCQVSKQILAQLYGLDARMIKEDNHGNFKIYTVGSYPNYQKASEAKAILRKQNRIQDAFIVAFENGKRLRKLPE
jgi:hypothetical protein